MHEPQRLVEVDEVKTCKCSRCGAQCTRVDIGELRDKRAVGTVAQHGNCPGNRSRLGGQTRKPHLHRPRNGLRSDPFDHPDRAFKPFGLERPHELVEEQRVPAGGAMAGQTEIRLRICAQAGPDQLCHGRGG